MLTGLAQMDATIKALSSESALHCTGLNVTVYDPDVVTRFNVGRQLFFPSDIGQSKAACLVHRVNLMYGTAWKAVPEVYDPLSSETNRMRPDLVVTCTDTARSRRDLHRALWQRDKFARGPSYWLDCANLATVGQVVLGQPGRSGEEGWPRNQEYDPKLVRWKGQRKLQIPDEDGKYNTVRTKEDHEIRLPCVTELFPDLLDDGFEETDEPSCSMVDAQRKQSLFVNRTVSAYALDLLWELLREERVDNQGCYFNLRTRTAQAIPLKVWPIAGTRNTRPHV